MKKKNKNTKVAKKKLTVDQFDQYFDEGGSILPYADLDAGVFRVNVDFPVWMLQRLNGEADRIGISRQALIKMWITDKLDQIEQKTKKPTNKKSVG